MGAYGDDALGRRLVRLLAPNELDERVTASELVAEAGIMSWHRTHVVGSDGVQHTRYAVMHPGAVAILALDATTSAEIRPTTPLWLVRQMRSVTKRVLLEIPAGAREVIADQGEVPAAAAARELEEETGLRAGTWQHLRTFYTAPGFSDERMALYLALDLSEAGATRRPHDVDEQLEAFSLTIAEAEEAVHRGAIRDAKSLIAIGIAGALSRHSGVDGTA